MKRLPILFFICLLFQTGCSQNNQQSTFWKISGNGLEKPSYLFGTFHLFCQGEVQIDETVLNKFEEVNEVYMELDMDDPQLRSKIQQHMFLEGGKTIKDYMTADEYDAIDQFVQDSLGMPLNRLNRIKPFFLSSMVMVRGFMECQPAQMETILVQKASQNGLEVNGLETIEEQMKALGEIPNDFQIDELLKVINNPEENVQKFDKMKADYNQGNIDVLHQLVEMEMKEHSKSLIDIRNQNWVEKMPEIMEERSALIAVGSGHLGGEKGLVNLLKEKGYSVEPVKL